MFPIFLFSLSVSAAPDDFKFEFDGYYRMRSHSFSNLYEDQEGPGKYTTQRLRIQPTFNFQDRAKFIFMADVLDDVVWGDNESLASTALFAGGPSNNGLDGSIAPTFNLKRAWIEMNVILGKMRVGRQPSHWGMGLLANSGDGFDDYFGDNHGGANFDRILFATRPIAVAQKLMGKKPAKIPFIVGYAFDRLVESPRIKYYGYQCEAGIADGEEGWDPNCDSNEDGLTDLDHGYTDDTFSSDNRPRNWAFDGQDDVTEHVLLAIYKGENVPIAGSAADLTVGFYGINRKQAETDSNVLILDGYTKFFWKGIYLEGEVLNIAGESSAIALPGAFDQYSDNPDPLYKKVDIWAYSARAGYKTHDWSAILETGYASGDENVADDNFTGRPIHPDYNVGLLIYDEILAAASAASWGEAASSLWSKGGVYNSSYIYPVVSYNIFPGWSLTAAYLRVWPDRPDGATIQCAEGDTLNGEPLDCPLYNATESHIGDEIDFAFKAAFHNHILFSLETGYARITDRVKLSNVGLDPAGKFYTIQSRLAYEF